MKIFINKLQYVTPFSPVASATVWAAPATTNLCGVRHSHAFHTSAATMSDRGSRSELGFAAALQHDLSIFQPGIMPAGEVIERADGSRLSVHFLGEVPPGEVFKTRRGNTIARAGHGRVVLLGGLHERAVDQGFELGPEPRLDGRDVLLRLAPRGLDRRRAPVVQRLVEPRLDRGQYDCEPHH